jgi:hypothetical protein
MSGGEHVERPSRQVEALMLWTDGMAAAYPGCGRWAARLGRAC